jgi:predicted nuclease with TOPRIM domain
MGHLENLEKLEELKKENEDLHKGYLEMERDANYNHGEFAALKEELAGNAEEIEALEDDLSNAEKELAEFNRQIEECELVPSECVICSYADVNDFIWARVKDICREEIPPQFQPLFDGNQFIKEFKSVKELTKENEELKSRVVDYEWLLKENEELKAKLARCEEKNKVCCEENATLFMNQKVSRRKNQKPRVFTSFVIADCPPMPEINAEGAIRRFQVVAGGAEAVCADKPEE